MLKFLQKRRLLSVALMSALASAPTVVAQQPVNGRVGGQPPIPAGAAGPMGQAPANANQLGQPIPVVPVNQAVAAGVAQVVQQPFPPLSAEDQAYVDQVLLVWEKHTASINTFECQFKRYIFNAAVDPKNPEAVTDGSIRFKNPDKGVFKEDTKYYLTGKKPDGSPDYKINDKAQFGDWWVCDGEWVHNLDRVEKKVVRTQLPPELRGNNIPLSPLPFLFGVKAAEVKSRYWVRPLPPPQGNNDVWVEAWPKRADDAGNYSRVQIALDRADSLPNAMILFMPNWAANTPNREVFNFTNREVNSSSLLDKIKENVFMKAFIDTNVGSDWTVEREPWIPPQQMPPEGQPGSSSPLPNGRVAAPGVNAPGAGASQPALR